MHEERLRPAAGASGAAATTAARARPWNPPRPGSTTRLQRRPAGAGIQRSAGARNFFYNDLGRPARTETSLDSKNYVQEWTFDPFGRPFQQFFQAAGQPRTGEQNRYEGGYLREIRSAYPLRDGRVLAYREIQAVNARGQAVKERAAPGMEYSQERRFDDDTGRLREILVVIRRRRHPAERALPA